MGWLDHDDNKANEAGGDFSPIPMDTELQVRITGAERKDTKTGGAMVRLEFTVMQGPHRKRRIWQNWHIVNANESMMHLHRREVKDIGRIVHVDVNAGEGALRNLKGRDLICKVVEHENDTYQGKTRIKEKVGKFRTDPEANNSSSSFDDDDVPF